MKLTLTIMQSGLRILTLLIVACVLCLALINAGTSRRASIALQNNDITIINNTRAFFVLKAERKDDDVQLVFRNDYQKPINAFSLSAGPNSGVEIDLVHGEHEIAPQASYSYHLFASNLVINGPSETPLKLSVLNVVFDDGSGDGDPVAIASINERRRGEKVALIKVIPLLLQASEVAGLDTIGGIRRLKERIAATCDRLEREQPSLARGIEHSKGYVLEDLEKLEMQMRDGSNLGYQLARIRMHYERVSAKLRD